MTRKIRFTKQAIEALRPAAPGKRDYYQDARYKSLRVSVTATGTKSWVLQRRINGRVLRLTLGGFPDLTPENAVKKYEQNVGAIAGGRDPQSEKKEARSKRLTLNDAFEEFLRVRQSLKPSTVRVYRQLMNTALGDWLSRPLAHITKNDVAERHAKLTRTATERAPNGSAAYANGAMRTLRAVWNFAAGQYETSSGESLLPPNPVERLSRTKAWNKVRPRQSYVREADLEEWFKHVQLLRNEPWGTTSQTVGDYLVFLLLTGTRRNEAARLTWEQVDLQGRTFKLLDTKNRQDHTLPLSDYLHQLLSEREKRKAELVQVPKDQERANWDFVFPSTTGQGPIQEPREDKQRVIDAAKIQFTFHDLRRTFITAAERLDLSAYTLSRLANHQLGHPVTRDYIVTDVERLRDPMQRITNYFLSAAGIRRAVVKMKAKERARK